MGDTLILEVEILVRSVNHYSKPEPKKEEAKDETKPSEPVAAPPTSQVPSSEKEVVDTKAKVDTKPLNQTKEGIQAAATPTSDKEVIKSSPPPSVTVETKIPPKVIIFRVSSSSVQEEEADSSAFYSTTKIENYTDVLPLSAKTDILKFQYLFCLHGRILPLSL